MKKLLLVLCILLLASGAAAQDDDTARALIPYGEQELFLNGINLAWINFAHDLENFDEPRFVAALDELAAANGNTLRWWLHTNGASSPIYGDDNKVTGLGEYDVENLHRAADLAYERGILLMPTLWSHDMMNDVEGVPTDANKLMIEDAEYTQAYIDNALTPLVEGLKGHPGIVAWEIFNEPEGTTTEFGWTDQRTTMASIQQFVNLLAGAIRRADPDALVTNGAWSMRAQTDVDGKTNYYTDERLIAAGGDPDGTLDFYQVHYYPEHFPDSENPFSHPYSYWELDKPLIVGEFPALPTPNRAAGFRMRNSMETYEFLYENGYAGALAWTFYASDFGKMLDAAPGMLRVNNLAPEHVQVEIGEIDRIPVVVATIPNAIAPIDTAALENYADLDTIFTDQEGALEYAVTANSKPELVEPTITGSLLSLAFPSGALGTSALEITATDTAGHTSRTRFVVQVIDPSQGNVAHGKSAAASSVESVAYLAEFAVDGLENTRWSSEYADNQTLDIDLGGIFTISQFVLRWETAYGAAYDIQLWDGAAWQTVYSEPAGDGQIDDITLDAPVDARYVRLNAVTRGTQWGFSLWEFEVNGIAASGGDAALAAAPPDLITAVPAAETAAPAAATADLLHSFEDGTEGFVLADYWAGGVGMDVSADMASEGAQSLAILASFSGAEWMEAGAFVNPEGGADWSNVDQLALDVYVPEGADNFLAQIFVKTGDDWAWANTADTPLTPGAWTTVTADLAALGDPSALGEYGIKVGTSTTAFDGTIYVDNVRLLAAAAEESAAPAAPTGADTLLNSFEDGIEGFVLADYWAGGVDMDVSADMASEGAQSLAIQASFSGAEWMEAGAFVNPEGGADWSAAAQLAMDVYVPPEGANFLAQIFVKTGDDWAWANTPDIRLTPGEWTTVTADLATLGDAATLHEYGIKVGTSSTAFDGTIYVDNIRLIGATETAKGGGTAPTTPPDEYVDSVVNVVNIDNIDELINITIPLYEKVEIIAEIDAQFNNPYDPTDIRVDGRFTAPSGRVIVVPGFYYRDFTVSGSSIQPTDDWSWRVRFTPAEVGEYRYQVLATTSAGTKRSAAGTFTVAASENPGFIRVDPRNPRYFVFDDGTPYFPVGENIGWSVGNPLADYPVWLDRLSAAGGNWIRVWMASWGFGIEWLDTGLGSYDRRQAQAFQLDRVFEMAAERDVYIMLSLINHGQFSETTDTEWANNPYNAANGGPLETPAEFATHPEALRLWNQRLRYIAARWGYSPNLMTWEWWNEINWTALVNPELLAPWVARSAAYLSSLDPYNHLITHSGSPVGDASVWGQDSIDFTQNHIYDPADLLGTFASSIAEWLARYPDKPFLMGEFGSPSEIDTIGLYMHLGLWSAPMNGAAGTGMMWWWDSYVHPLDMYHQFTGVSAFFGGEDMAAHEWQATTAAFAERTGARVYGLQADDRALLWVVSRDYDPPSLQRAYNRAIRDALRSANQGTPTPTAPQPLVFEFEPIEGATLVVSDLADGAYTVEFWDTVTGEVTETRTLDADDGTLIIDLPPFATDIAIKVK